MGTVPIFQLTLLWSGYLHTLPMFQLTLHCLIYVLYLCSSLHYLVQYKYCIYVPECLLYFCPSVRYLAKAADNLLAHAGQLIPELVEEVWLLFFWRLDSLDWCVRVLPLAARLVSSRPWNQLKTTKYDPWSLMYWWHMINPWSKVKIFSYLPSIQVGVTLPLMIEIRTKSCYHTYRYKKDDLCIISSIKQQNGRWQQ